MDKERDYIQELERAFYERPSNDYVFKVVIAPINLYFGLERQMICKGSYPFHEDGGIKAFGRRVIGSPHVDKIEFY